MPVVGFADGAVEPFATCFGISQYLPLAVTAWHVVDGFVEEHADALTNGSCHIAVIRELGETDGSGNDLGTPIHQDGSDLALLTLYDVRDEEGAHYAPDCVTPLGFSCPSVGEYCYGFGYPVMSGGVVRNVGGRSTVDFQRDFKRSAGLVRATFPNGQGTSVKVHELHFDGDLPTPSGLSGGPVFTDQAQICSVISSSYSPHFEDERWASYVSLLAPLLEFELELEEGGAQSRVSVRDLVESGNIDAVGAFPPPPTTIPVTISRTFGRPHL
jgi:hypothetical protein